MTMNRGGLLSSVAVLLLLLLFFVSSAVAVAVAGDSNSDECVYTLYVKTGSIIKSGTDSKIGVKLSDASGRSVSVSNLEAWGLMGPSHDYYEWGNTDIFTGRGPCMGGPVCRLNITSDGSGDHHGWFCDYVEVTSTGPHKGCRQTIFHVQQWLATDAPPYQLSAVLDGCGDGGQDDLLNKGAANLAQVRNRNGRLVVGNPQAQEISNGVASSQ